MKSFFALKATGSVALIGITGLTASIDTATIEINDARPATTGAIPHAINFSAHPLVVATGPATSQTLDFAGPLFRASGNVKISIGGFVYLAGSVTFEKGTTLTAQPLTGGGTVDLTALTIAATGVNAFVGNGFVDANGDGILDTGTSAIGLSLSGVSFGLALLTVAGIAAEETCVIEAIGRERRVHYPDAAGIVGVANDWLSPDLPGRPRVHAAAWSKDMTPAANNRLRRSAICALQTGRFAGTSDLAEPVLNDHTVIVAAMNARRGEMTVEALDPPAQGGLPVVVATRRIGPKD